MTIAVRNGIVHKNKYLSDKIIYLNNFRNKITIVPYYEPRTKCAVAQLFEFKYNTCNIIPTSKALLNIDKLPSLYLNK